MNLENMSITVPFIFIFFNNPVNTRRWTNVASMLDHRLRRWPNFETKLAQSFVFIEKVRYVK